MSQTSVKVNAAGGLYVVAEGAVHWVTPKETTVQLDLVGSRIQIAGLAGQFLSPVRLVPAAAGLANAVRFGTRRYRGEIEVIVGPDSGKLTVINALNLEEYVQGVVPVEMTPTWPAEALKAQAVAARSYVRTAGKQRKRGFDVVSHTEDQAYGGLESETPATNAAVAATRGQVITYRAAIDQPSQIVTAYYFSSSGGHTEDAENVWGFYHAYLRGVPDFDNLPGNFRFSWRSVYTPEEVSQKLTSRGHEVGEVESIKPDEVVSKSGRPTKWHVTGRLDGQTRTVSLNGEEIRKALGLFGPPKQILFKLAGLVDGNREIGPKETVSVVGADRVVRQRQAQGTIILGSKLALVLNSTHVLGPKVEQAAGVEAHGGGYGHGVGMSQWGAHGMALLGKNYKEILTHYYTGVQVETR